MARIFTSLLKALAVLLFLFIVGVQVFNSGESEYESLCAEAGKLGEEAWRDCVDYYLNAGFTLDQINGKAPISNKTGK